MDENNKESSLDSIRLTYNEKNKRIVANLITDVDGVKVRSRTIDNFDNIKVLLDALGKQTKLSISELIDLGIITVDDRLLNQGVFVIDANKEYQKYTFDTVTGKFVSSRLTRTEQKELGLREDFGIYRSEMPEEKVVIEEKPAPEEKVVIEERTIPEEVTVEIEEPAVDSAIETKENHVVYVNANASMPLLYELTEIIQRLNPNADIRVGKDGEDEKASYRFYSSIPVDSLNLPENCRLDEDNRGWIKCIIDTQVIHFFVKDLSLADESKLAPSVKEYILGTKGVEENKEKEKSTKNLKLYKRAFAILGVAAVVLVGSLLAKKKDSNKTNDYAPNNDAPIENQQEELIIDPNYYNEDGVHEETYYYNDENTHSDANNHIDPNYYSEDSVHEETNVEDVKPKIDYVNSVCGTHQPCVFYDLVGTSDMETVKIINDARNAALNDHSKLFDVVDQYARYIFEGSTMFNGNAVKGYYYVSPLSRYIILTSAQTLLELCQDYNYSTAVNIYTFDNLMISFDELIDETYRELMVIDKTK